MIFHTSIAADEPQSTAEFIARLWKGRAYPFPPFGKGSWIAMAGDDRCSAIEVYPRGTEMHLGSREDHEVQHVCGAPVREQANHSAIASSLDADQIISLAQKAGTPARLCDRGPFRVIEVWIDGCSMFEVLTPEMQREYQQSMTFEGWEDFVRSTSPCQ